MKTNHTDEQPTNTERTVDEVWKLQVRDWWYSIQDECNGMMHTLPEKKRVEIEHIIKTTLLAERQRAEGEKKAVYEDFKKVFVESGQWAGIEQTANLALEMRAIATRNNIQV